MKKIALGAATALALAAPGLAHADTSGYVDTGYANSDYDTGGDFDLFHLGGAVQFDGPSGWAITLEGRTALQDWSGSSGNDSQAHAAVHADTNTGAWDFGGWVGLLNYYGNGGWTVGGETRTSFGNFSVQGSLGYGDFDQFFDYSALNANIQGSYFINPNFAINARVAQTWIDYAPNDYEALDLGIGAGYGFGNGFELYGGYTYSDYDPDIGAGYEVDTFNLGVRYHFNGGTLQDVANDGASWGGVQALSDAFTRW